MQKSLLMVSLSCLAVGSCQDVSLGNSVGTDGGSGGILATGGSTGEPGTGRSGTGGAVVPGGNGGATSLGGEQTGGVAGDTGVGGVAGNTGGQTGTGGAVGPGGGGSAVIDAGSPPSTDAAVVSSDTPSAASCSFEVTTKTAKIPTVGIVTWSTDLADLKEAHIDFGLDTSYGMTAPVDSPSSSSNTTLLLGMKPSNNYHYRITATGSGGDCTSPDYTIMTGLSLSGLPKITVEDKSTASPAYGGFLITGQLPQTSTGVKSPAYIVDKDGEIVWAVRVTSDVTGVCMSYDGKYMWVNSANVPGPSSQSVHRVTMDGERDEDLSAVFVGQHLRLTVLPDETVVFIAYGSNGCDDIKEYSPSGTVRTVVNAGTAQGVTGNCHVVDVQYSKDDDTLVFSDLDHQSLVKVQRSSGATLWVLNGSHPSFTGATWQGGQWGIHVLGLDQVLLFANNSLAASGGGGGSGDGSSAIEMSLDLTGRNATKVWSFKSTIQNDVMGDVQRLPSGNTIIAYSTKGKLHEVDANGTLLQEWTWAGLTNSFGYIEKRPTLYGPPPR
jgi:hypothetical protein